MKNLFFAGLVLMTTVAAQAKTISSDRANAQVNVARVTSVTTLVNKPGMQVSVAVVDIGGSTDLAPTQSLRFNIYSKGEMFSTDASFDLGAVIEFKSASRISGGIYQVQASVLTDQGIVEKTFKVDAIKAINEMQAITCQDFDCAASNNFKSTIEVSE